MKVCPSESYVKTAKTKKIFKKIKILYRVNLFRKNGKWDFLRFCILNIPPWLLLAYGLTQCYSLSKRQINN